MAAAVSRTDQELGNPPCSLVICGDGRQLMFHVQYEAASKLPAGCKKLQASCSIGNGDYTCKAWFFPQIPTREFDSLFVVIEGPSKANRVIVNMCLVDNTRSVPLSELQLISTIGARRDLVGAQLAKSVGGYRLTKSVGGYRLTKSVGGYRLTGLRRYLEEKCVKDGVLVALCSVFIVPHMLPPDSLAHRLAAMSNDQGLTDVCFDVDGEKFNAHRLVMAVQSEVFRAELFGSMAESKMNCITVPDMSASTFKHMLHYIYCNELTAAVNDNDMDESSRIFELQHLLVAADRYGLDTLKQLCEDTLCAGITTDTVTSTLELAEASLYPKLRASCLEYLSDTEIFAEVATTNEFCKLIQSYPDVPTEIRNRFKRPRLSLKLTPSTDTKDQNNP